MGWTVSIVFGVTALLQTIVLIDGLVRISRWQCGVERRLQELEERDVNLFAQGKSLDEIIAQYKTPKP